MAKFQINIHNTNNPRIVEADEYRFQEGFIVFLGGDTGLDQVFMLPSSRVLSIEMKTD